MTIRVYIGTTEGPVEVQRITLEQPPVSSVVCVDGLARPLRMSADYDDFVRVPTGIIERQFGGRQYRLDVSTEIASGNSWQLGFFVAHSLDSSGHLAVKDQPADQDIWLTGEVDVDLNVRPVDHIAEKIHASRGLLFEAVSSGRDIKLVVPFENLSEARSALGRLHPEGLQNVNIHGVREAEDALVTVSSVTALPEGRAVSLQRADAENLRLPGHQNIWRHPLVILAGCAALGLVAVGALTGPTFSRLHTAWSGHDLIALEALLDGTTKQDCWGCGVTARMFSAYLRSQTPSIEDVSLTVTELKAHEGRLCPPARAFSTAQFERQNVPQDPGSPFDRRQGIGVCGLEFCIAGHGDESRVGGYGVVRTQSAFVRLQSDPLPPQPRDRCPDIRLAWRLPFEQSRPIHFRLIGYKSRHPGTAVGQWLRKNLSDDHVFRAEHVTEAASRLARMGVTLTSRKFELRP